MNQALGLGKAHFSVWKSQACSYFLHLGFAEQPGGFE